MTLFFLQLFQTVTNRHSAERHRRPVRDPQHRPVRPPGRPQAADRARRRLRGLYLYVALAIFVVVFVALRLLNNSRTGRAWRSLREDPLAAEAMGMPVNWLKLLSFSFGAAVAALTGTLYAALYGNVFPLSFYFVTLITDLHHGDPRRLRQPGGRRARRARSSARCSSCCATPTSRASSSSSRSSAALALVGRRRPRIAIVAGATLVFGFVLHAIARAIDSVVGRRPARRRRVRARSSSTG